MKKALVIAGPTGSGKTGLSIELAKRYGCSIISGDSIQVYKGFDIGSGKIREDEMQGVHHDLLSFKEPQEAYSVADFQAMARAIMDQSDAMKIICGGTGLYLKACLYDYVFSQEASVSIAKELLEMDNASLHEILRKEDPRQAEKIHVNNRQRLLRSVTILKTTGRRQSEIEAEQKHEMVYDAFILGCTWERSKLYERINQRVEAMFASGLEEEVKGLLDKGVSFDDPAMKGIGYREWRSYFQGNSSLDLVKEEIQKHSRQFAKRQYTWFNHQMPVHWLDMESQEAKQAMLEEIDEWRKT